jgi:hypothetical protein
LGYYNDWVAIRKTISPKESAASLEPAVEELRARAEVLRSRLSAAIIAFMKRAELDGKIPEFEDVSKAAEAMIEANYQLQRQLYGKVRIKLSVAKLLRGRP